MLTTTVIAIEGITLLSVFGVIFLFDFATLFIIQTSLVSQNKTATDKGHLQGDLNIYKDKSLKDNWEQVFTGNVLTWLLPIGSPDLKQALDYGANIPVGGLLTDNL